MAQISKAITENTVRTATFTALNIPENAQFVRISNQSYGAVFTDDNGVERMVELRAIVRKVDEELSGSEMLATEAQAYADRHESEPVGDGIQRHMNACQLMKPCVEGRKADL